MQENERHTQSEKHTPLEPHAHRGRKVWKICLIVLAAVILIPVALLFALYLYLTPARLGEIASTQLSKRLRAEVTVKAIDYRLFSTFPRLYLDADSILIRSRALSAPYDSIERRSLWCAILTAISLLSMIPQPITLSCLHILSTYTICRESA